MMSESEINGVPENKKTFSPLEFDMDQEYDSLVHETGDFPRGFGHVVSTLTLRKKARRTTTNIVDRARVLGLLHSQNAGFALRNALFLAMLGGAALLFLHTMDTTVELIEQHNMATSSKRGPHQSHFGGEQNVGQPGGAIAYNKQQHANENDVVEMPPQSPLAVPSLSQENVVNHVGHYWNDPHSSPYASHLYKSNSDDSILALRKQEFENKTKAVKQQYGAWNLTDTYYELKNKVRPTVAWEEYEYADVPLDKFPADAWQLDEPYVGRLLNESKALIGRVKEAIYAEYGHATEENMTPQEVKERDKLFRVIVDSNLTIVDGVAVDNDNTPLKGIAYLAQHAWDGLVTKLLHTILTGDYFYVVLGGDAAAAGKGNNFVQSQMMQFHYIMEPVFDFLDTHLVSRNMAMPFSTVASALGGKDIYGEADVMLWSVDESSQDDKTPVKQLGPPELFNKQATMSGERVPVLLTPLQTNNLLTDSKGLAWVGNLQAGAEMCPETLDDKATDVTPACKFLNCPPKHAALCNQPRYNSVCWVDRTDHSPDTQQKQHVDVDADAHYPGPLAHQLEGRKLALLLLHALDAALNKWSEGIEQDGFPLKEKYWHVGEAYKEIQQNVRTAYTGNDDRKDGCEELFHEFPIVCRVPMHAFTEWTPRVTPATSNLRAIVGSDVEIFTQTPELAYKEMDLLPLEWKIPVDAVDVHAVATATNAPAPETNEFGQFDDEYDDFGDDFYYGYQDGDDDVSVRQLSTPTEHVVKREYMKDTSPGGRAISRVHSWVRRVAQDKDKEIVPGMGWMLYNENAGFCDGSAQSTCKRSADSDCLMAGHNDGQAGLLGDALSGWLILQVPKVKNGVILARFQIDIDADVNEATDGWTVVNQGSNGAEDNGRRRMYIPREFEFDYAINGKIQTLSGHEFINKGVDITDDLTVWPLLLDEDMSKRPSKSDDEGETIEVAMRIRSESGRGATILLSHIYYS